MTETAKRKRDALRGVFILAVAVGSAGIVAGWLLESTLGAVGSGVVTVAVPVVVMLLYLAAGWVLGRSNLATPLFADSLYYLGFLFTLIALAVSLAAAESNNVSGVTLRFATALSTTVIGLTLRILLVHFHAATDDSLQSAEHRLAEASESLGQAIDALTDDITSQRRTFTQALAKAIESTDAELMASIKSGSRALESAAKNIAETTDKSATHLDKVLRKASDKFAEYAEDATSDLSEAIRGGATSVKGAADDLATKLRASKVPADVLVGELAEPLAELRKSVKEHNKKLKASLDTHEQLTEDVGKLTGALNEVASGAEDLAETVGNFKAAKGSIDSTTGDLKKLANAVASVVNALKTHKKAIDVHAGAIEAAGSQICDDAELASAYRDEIKEHLSEATSAVGKVQRELVRAAEYVADELTGSPYGSG